MVEYRAFNLLVVGSSPTKPIWSHRLDGLGRHPFKVKTRVRIPLGLLTIHCHRGMIVTREEV